MSTNPTPRGAPRRTLLSAVGLAAVGAPLGLSANPAHAAVEAPAVEPFAPRSVLWSADPALGPAAVFDGLERDPGTIDVANDPQGRFGRCIRYRITDLTGSKERCESRGMRLDGRPFRLGSAQEGQIFFFGWRALWSPLPIASGRWCSVYQLHISGASGGQPKSGPYVLRTLGDGRLHFQLTSPSGSSQHIWSTQLRIGVWQTFVIGFRLSRSNSGWTQFWYNGARQTFSNGQQTFPGATLWGSHVNTKWGIYRSGPNNGAGTAYLNSARLGTSLADVAL